MYRYYPVVTLCGSTRFKKEFEEVQKQLTLDGFLVISVGLFSHEEENSEEWMNNGTKEMLDDLHKAKIRMSDAIYVIDAEGGYIGSSTKSEIEYAKFLNLPVFYYSKGYINNKTLLQTMTTNCFID